MSLPIGLAQLASSGIVGAGGFEGTSAWAFACALGLVALGLTVFSLAGEVSRPVSPAAYQQLQEQQNLPAAAHADGPVGSAGIHDAYKRAEADAEQSRQSCEMQASPAVCLAMPMPGSQT